MRFTIYCILHRRQCVVVFHGLEEGTIHRRRPMTKDEDACGEDEPPQAGSQSPQAGSQSGIVALSPRNSNTDLPEDDSGRFVRTDHVLGMGSTKVVYQARDEEEGIDVAWNEVSISASAETVDKFKNEIRVLENLQHSNVIKCSCHFWEGDKLIFISEFMSSNLKDYILKSKNKRLKLKVLCFVLDSAARNVFGASSSEM